MTYQHHKCGIVCQKHLTHSDAEGKLQRPSDKRHALARSVDHLSIVTVDHVPSNIPQSSFPARSFIFEDNEVGHSHDHQQRKPKFEALSSHSPC